MDRGLDVTRIVKWLGYSTLRKDVICDEEIKPGSLLEWVEGSEDTVQNHSTAAGNVYPVMVAEVDFLQGKGILDSDGNVDSYSSGDRAVVYELKTGDRALFRCGADANISANEKVQSAGDGTVESAVLSDSSATSERERSVIGTAVHGIDLSNSSSAEEEYKDYFVLVEVV